MKITNSPIFWFVSALIFFLIGIGISYLAFGLFVDKEKKNDEIIINSYEECVEAGYPIMESYPEQCAVPGGKTFTREVNWENGIEDIDRNPDGSINDPRDSDSTRESADHYGTSTFASCQANSDCGTGGCSSEFCSSSDDARDIISVCILPSGSSPASAGYSCGCVQNKCQWAKPMI